MARRRSRRTRTPGARRSLFRLPRLRSPRGGLIRPELVGTLLVVLAVAALPFLLPVGDVLGRARDSLVRALGLHVFTLILGLALLGGLLAARRTSWLRAHPRHLVGALALLLFSFGVLAFWRPAVDVGEVDLAVTSAGGRFGRALIGWPGVLGWLALLALGFALLWPVTARALARSAPGAIGRGVAAGGRWLWGLGVQRAVTRLVRGFARPGLEAPSATLEYAIEDMAGEPLDSLAVARPDLDEVGGGGRPRRRRQLPMDLETPVEEWRHSADGWQLPPLDLLEEGKPEKLGEADRQRRARLIVETLASFGVDARVVEVNAGPTVTQFGVEPGWDVRTRTVQERDAAGQALIDANGRPRTKEIEVSRTRIRVNRITALQNDLALALAAPALRIEAPVPGKPIVGIEVPNTTSSVVTMRSVMSSPVYRRFVQKAELPIALGAGVSGDPVVADLARMPHLLIAGATGSGKSVCLNAIITCLLMNFSPEELRLVLIDPKRVELTPYQAIPHLAFSDIIVDMDRVVGTLQAVINEMESRYRRFAQAGVRDIRRYNEQAAKAGGRKLPYWTVIIDELADLMLVAPYQVENQVVRLAQLARATGIHLIIATQRPSVDVVTGLIKANFPTRIAFAVASQVDSRTVLDQAGAEKLLGRGDMLYVPPEAQKPRRVQGVYLSDHEIEQVIRFWTSDRFGELVPEKLDGLLEEAAQQIEAAAEGGTSPDDDPLLARAIALARDSVTISTSLLQRRLRVGYPRAARLMDDLEARGIVGPSDGSSSREVLLHEPPVPAELAAPAPPTGDAS